MGNIYTFLYCFGIVGFWVYFSSSLIAMLSTANKRSHAYCLSLYLPRNCSSIDAVLLVLQWVSDFIDVRPFIFFYF
jgi:hypothetical protein